MQNNACIHIAKTFRSARVRVVHFIEKQETNAYLEKG